jgi:hypothetical protein
MNRQFKYFLVTAATVAFPWFVVADTTTTNSEVQTTETHWGHEYDDSGWRRNLTLSVGADALRSNAKYSGGSSTATLSADPKWGFGGMAAVELGLADYAGVAIGVHYLERRFQISGGAVDWTRTIPTMFIPVEARFYLAKVLSIGAGGFAAFAVGHTKDSFKTGNSTLVNTGSSRNGVDFGLTAALGVNIPIGPLGVFGEARYNFGLTDSASNSDVEEKIRDLLFTVGVKFKI